MLLLLPLLPPRMLLLLPLLPLPLLMLLLLPLMLPVALTLFLLATAVVLVPVLVLVQLTQPAPQAPRRSAVISKSNISKSSFSFISFRRLVPGAFNMALSTCTASPRHGEKDRSDEEVHSPEDRPRGQSLHLHNLRTCHRGTNGGGNSRIIDG
jgi:hypothetical protein